MYEHTEIDSNTPTSPSFKKKSSCANLCFTVHTFLSNLWLSESTKPQAGQFYQVYKEIFHLKCDFTATHNASLCNTYQ